jgi:alpha-tubulin suppressor-like RCC1 family protein
VPDSPDAKSKDSAVIDATGVGEGDAPLGSDADSATPVPSALAGGLDHVCAVLSNGTVKCWGYNAQGQLGLGTSTGPDTCVGGAACSTTPMEVSGLTGVTAIAAGPYHTCALLSGGTVVCWGDNQAGELGNGSTSGPDTCGSDPCSTSPVAVSGLTGVKAISARGSFTTCALLSTGTVECWGDNTSGELGIGSSTGPDMCTLGPCSTVPVEVSGLTGVTAISVGGVSCAVLSTGTLECWGSNEVGGLGNGNPLGPDTCTGPIGCSTVPIAVPGLTGVTAVSAGAATCALLSGGTVDCWGYNDTGEVGDGTSTGPDTCGPGACATAPVPVSGVTGATGVFAGRGFTCALLGGGTVDCWGENSAGELGDGTSTGPETCDSEPCSTTPGAVSGLSGVVTLATFGGGCCALLKDGIVECWGDNSEGALANGGTTGPDTCGGEACSTAPVVISGL